MLAKPVKNILPGRNDWPRDRLAGKGSLHGCAGLRRSSSMLRSGPLLSGMLRRLRPVAGLPLRRWPRDRGSRQLWAYLRPGRARNGAGNRRPGNGGRTWGPLIPLARAAEDLARSGPCLQWSCRNWSSAPRSGWRHGGSSGRWGGGNRGSRSGGRCRHGGRGSRWSLRRGRRRLRRRAWSRRAMLHWWRGFRSRGRWYWNTWRRWRPVRLRIQDS